MKRMILWALIIALPLLIACGNKTEAGPKTGTGNGVVDVALGLDPILRQWRITMVLMEQEKDKIRLADRSNLSDIGSAERDLGLALRLFEDSLKKEEKRICKHLVDIPEGGRFLVHSDAADELLEQKPGRFRITIQGVKLERMKGEEDEPTGPTEQELYEQAVEAHLKEMNAVAACPDDIDIGSENTQAGITEIKQKRNAFEADIEVAKKKRFRNEMIEIEAQQDKLARKYPLYGAIRSKQQELIPQIKAAYDLLKNAGYGKLLRFRFDIQGRPEGNIDLDLSN